MLFAFVGLFVVLFVVFVRDYCCFLLLLLFPRFMCYLVAFVLQDLLLFTKQKTKHVIFVFFT